ncbi:MAG: DNA-directed RNA polymerase subunit D [Candidatus Woesearchaeota archaeon]|jgi:DNA-directed RNA polymerase subunit D|nr:DNA-directed RNA polymerase subunit D [Candidatus Woesearchaeota archaeon]
MVEFKDNGVIGNFKFKDESNLIVNSIRRIIIDEVPTFAIEDVEVVINGSPLYDETIAQRLGLIPIKTDLSSYNMKKDCKCGGIGCAMCEVKMTLSQDEAGYVLSGKINSDDPQVIPIDLDIPITKIFGDAKFELNLKAILGNGLEHAKWSPAHTYMKETKTGIELIVEPHGQLSSKETYNKAIDILIEKITDLEGQL